MDFMDIDQIDEVPDTPERFLRASNNDVSTIGNRSDGSSSCRVIDKDRFNERLRNEPREKGKSVHFHGNRRLFVRPDDCSNSPGFILGNSSSSKSVLHTAESRRNDKGKTSCNSNVQRSTCKERSSFVDLTEQNGYGRVFEKATSTGASGFATLHPSKKHQFSAHGFSASDTSSKSPGLNNTVKLGPKMDRGKGIAQNNAETNSSSLASTPPRVHRHRRLVRNGCISPHNIAISKQVAEKNDTGKVSKDLQAEIGNIPSSGPSNTVDIKDLIAEANDARRFKGKGVSHHFPVLEEPDARNQLFSQRSSVKYKEATDAGKNLRVDPSTCFKESEGWINTHNTTRKVGPTSVDSDQHISRGKPTSSSALDQLKNRKLQRDHRNRSTSSNIYNHFEDMEIDSTQCVSVPSETVPRRAQNSGQLKEREQLAKRQREGVASSNTTYSNDSDIVSRTLHGEPSTSRSTRNKNRRDAGTSNPLIAIDESSPDDGNHDSSTHPSNNEDSTVRALQLEADEMLARELQEQLYNEELTSAFGTDEMDPHHALAMAMQLEHGSHAIHAGGRPAFRPASRSSPVPNLYQHSRSNASRNSSNNRGTRAQAPTSTRLARFRGRFPGRPRTLSSTTTRNSIFPPNMDVDMRMQILEALEAFNDMDLPGDLLQIGREFNENDYEMLLALDDNNHQHGGATLAQINNLPQSTVQAENLHECAICLEVPAIGETIRHLPCLHKFHKDCIDEWLRRKTSCPVCKSSIT